jgi:hypothetical protein
MFFYIYMMRSCRVVRGWIAKANVLTASPEFQKSSTTLESEGQQMKHSCKQHVKIWAEEKILHSPFYA